ncbi:SigE family RNA polymerase sigma factor [Glycomyces albus]
MTPENEHDFRDFVESGREPLLRTAFLICGDWHRAEDAVQNSLIKLYGAWTRIRRETADSYARRVLANTLVDDSRRGWFRREQSYADPPEPARSAQPAAPQIEAAELLAGLPRRQRATLVLRFWEDLSVDQTAQILRCSPGTVKSNTARGLQSLRERSEALDLTSERSQS